MLDLPPPQKIDGELFARWNDDWDKDDKLLAVMGAAERLCLAPVMEAASHAMARAMPVAAAAPRLRNCWARFACAPHGAVVLAALDALRTAVATAARGHGLCGLPIDCLALLLCADDLTVAGEDEVLAVVHQLVTCAAHAPPMDDPWVGRLLGCVRWGLVEPRQLLRLRERPPVGVDHALAAACGAPPPIPQRLLAGCLDDALRTHLELLDSHLSAAGRGRLDARGCLHLVAAVDTGGHVGVGRSPPSVTRWAEWQVAGRWTRGASAADVDGRLVVTLRVRGALGAFDAHVRSPPRRVTGNVAAYTLDKAQRGGRIPWTTACFFVAPVDTTVTVGGWQDVLTETVGGAAVLAALAAVPAAAGGHPRWDPTRHVGVAAWLSLREAA